MVITKSVSRFPVYVFHASIAVTNIAYKSKVKCYNYWCYWKFFKIPQSLTIPGFLINPIAYSQTLYRKREKRLILNLHSKKDLTGSDCKIHFYMTANFFNIGWYITSVKSLSSSKQTMIFQFDWLPIISFQILYCHRIGPNNKSRQKI